MKLIAMELEDEKPSTATFKMTVAEAAILAKLSGKVVFNDAEAIMAGGNKVNSEAWACLTGALFNRFWDDGVDGYLRGDDA